MGSFSHMPHICTGMNNVLDDVLIEGRAINNKNKRRNRKKFISLIILKKNSLIAVEQLLASFNWPQNNNYYLIPMHSSDNVWHTRMIG